MVSAAPENHSRTFRWLTGLRKGLPKPPNLHRLSKLCDKRKIPPASAAWCFNYYLDKPEKATSTPQASAAWCFNFGLLQDQRLSQDHCDLRSPLRYQPEVELPRG